MKVEKQFIILAVVWALISIFLRSLYSAEDIQTLLLAIIIARLHANSKTDNP